jgi:hypothetical protein
VAADLWLWKEASSYSKPDDWIFAIQLLLVFSTHASFLSVRVVETRESSGTARSFQIMKSPICTRQSSTELSAMVYPLDPLIKASPLFREGAFLLLPDLL